MSASTPRRPAASDSPLPFRFNPRSGYSWLILLVILALAAYQAWQRQQPPPIPNPPPVAADPALPPASPRATPPEHGGTSAKSRGSDIPLENSREKPAVDQPAGESYQVIRVADGDTLTVRDSRNREIRVRLIGVDAPEIDHPDQNIRAEPGGYEAKIFTTRAVQKQRIRLVFDEGYEREDRYGRWLCYAYYQEGATEKFLNVELVRAGWASVYDDRRRFPYSAAIYRQLKAAQSEAQSARRGIYGN
ncbi:MAG: thermonuclease family protein [Pirellulales bacterium]|nr:thermonuclease family protein [Pirellulales bacterium]